MVIPRRCFPGQPKHGRIIKMESTWSTDHVGGGNRREEASPELETKTCVCGREKENPKLAPPCTNESNPSEARASPRPEGAEGGRSREGGALDHRLHRNSRRRQWRRLVAKRLRLEQRVRVLAESWWCAKEAKGGFTELKYPGRQRATGGRSLGCSGSKERRERREWVER